jgi:hypothetical protein
MKATTKRKLIGGSLRVASPVVAAGVPLLMMGDKFTLWVAEQRTEVALTGVGIIGAIFIGLIAIKKVMQLAKPAMAVVKRVKGPWLACLVVIGLIYLMAVGAKKLYPMTDDIINICIGSAASVGAGLGMDTAAEFVSPKAKKEDSHVDAG